MLAGLVALEVTGWQWWVVDLTVSTTRLDVEALRVAVWQIRLEASVHWKRYLTQENRCSSGKLQSRRSWCRTDGVGATWHLFSQTFLHLQRLYRCNTVCFSVALHSMHWTCTSYRHRLGLIPQVCQMIWVKISSTHALTLISWTRRGFNGVIYNLWRLPPLKLQP